MGTDASSLSPDDVIDVLERFVLLFVSEHDPLNYNPHLINQAKASLVTLQQWKEQQMKVIPNFEEIIDETILDALHDHYTDYDISDEEGE